MTNKACNSFCHFLNSRNQGFCRNKWGMRTNHSGFETQKIDATFLQSSNYSHLTSSIFYNCPFWNKELVIQIFLIWSRFDDLSQKQNYLYREHIFASYLTEKIRPFCLNEKKKIATQQKFGTDEIINLALHPFILQYLRNLAVKIPGFISASPKVVLHKLVTPWGVTISFFWTASQRSQIGIITFSWSNQHLTS